MRDVAPEELAASDGTDPSRPMLISIRGIVYDVTKGKDFYGPGGGWARGWGRWWGWRHGVVAATG
jgi:membrane-associated progesterone receptor component